MYNEYGLKYNQAVQNIAIEVLTEQATKYTAYQFFWDRGPIKDDFQKTLNDVLEKEIYCSVEFLQLRSVYLPDKFEKSIQETEVRKQETQKATAEQNKIIVQADTLVKTANLTKQATIVNF